ncbi:MAG: amino acid ABC transporter permease [Elainellaceae cyanobacterium]
MTTATPDPNFSAPPITQVGPIAWLRKNLFNGVFNSILTIVSALVIYSIISNLLTWAFTAAEWQVLSSNIQLFFVGRYPAELIWRAWMTFSVVVVLAGLSWGILSRGDRLFSTVSIALLGAFAIICYGLSIIAGGNAVREACDASGSCVGLYLLSGLTAVPQLWGMLVLLVISGLIGRAAGIKAPNVGSWLPLAWFISFFVIFWLLEGGLFLQEVELSRLGQTGLLLTLLTAIVSIVLSFPIGVLLALGRQSPLPVVRSVSVAYIEVIRGLPLIGILFMAQVMLPLVLPVGLNIPTLFRAMAGLTIFSSAYLAENVRGGLQSIPRGQIEAAKALGLNGALLTLLIVLPQALRAVIPTIVGQFISLFKDTSLLYIVGLAELVGISQSILSNPNFLGKHSEVYLFVAVIYFVFCYAMSFASRRIEKQLGVGQR